MAYVSRQKYKTKWSEILSLANKLVYVAPGRQHAKKKPTCGATSDIKVVKWTAFCFQWMGSIMFGKLTLSDVKGFVAVTSFTGSGQPSSLT